MHSADGYVVVLCVIQSSSQKSIDYTARVKSLECFRREGSVSGKF